MDSHLIPEETFVLDRSQNSSLQAQIREVIVSEVVAGRSPPGARLPSTRKLAKYLGVSRITISLAYQELVAHGYLETLDRSAYVISQSARIIEAARVPRAENRSDVDVGMQTDWERRLSRSLLERSRIEKPDNWRSYPFPFVYGQMDMSLFDHGAWRECASRAHGRRDFQDMASDAAAADDPMLVQYISSRALPRRGIAADPEQILVTVGAQNALWLTMQLLVSQGFHAVCENPGYPDTVTALHWLGGRVTLADVDQHGLQTSNLPPDTSAVFVTPSHHAPTAVTMPPNRRAELIDLANERDFVIVEDDYEFEMSFLAAPSPALKSLDRNGRVVYVGSFSKALFPGLRLGYLVAPEPFIREARHLRSLILRHPPGHQQRSVAYFLAQGYYDKLIRRMRAAFAERRAVMTAALLREGIEVAGAAAFGGTSLWIKGPDGLDSTQFAIDLREDGVLIEPGAPFFHTHRVATPYFRMAYSSVPLEKIDEGVERIGRRLRAR